MRIPRFIIGIFVAIPLLLVAGCSFNDEVEKELKSPCVTAPGEGGGQHPCGPRIRINDRWLS